MSTHKSYKTELALLDIYSGCGGMSTGLCLGAKLSGVDLVTVTIADSQLIKLFNLKPDFRFLTLQITSLSFKFLIEMGC